MLNLILPTIICSKSSWVPKMAGKKATLAAPPSPPRLSLLFLTAAQKSNIEEVCLSIGNQTYSLPFGQHCNASTEYSSLKHVFHMNKSRYGLS